LAVFKIIYSGKRREWTAKEISDRLHGEITQKRVTEVGKKLVGDALVNQLAGVFPVVYEKRSDVHHYKTKILAGARTKHRSSQKKAEAVGGKAVPKPSAPRPDSSPAALPPDPAYDVFLCHASEDKSFVDPLAQAIKDAGISVWYDKDLMSWGDDLRRSIDRGLINSKYGIVVFSKAFLKKKRWTEHELSGLFAKERDGRKVILPIWHDITQDNLAEYSLSFVDRIAMRSDRHSIPEIVQKLQELLAK
jgi:hypothetical protein